MLQLLLLHATLALGQAPSEASPIASEPQKINIYFDASESAEEPPLSSFQPLKDSEEEPEPVLPTRPTTNPKKVTPLGTRHIPVSAPKSLPPSVTSAKMKQQDQAPKDDPETPAEQLVLFRPLPLAVAPAVAPPAAAAPDRWWFMQNVQGYGLGSLLDDNRLSVSGWIEGSFTGSQAQYSNQPVVWNDRPNVPMLQQFWVRFERSVVTSGTTDPTFGGRLDILMGSDYRFTLPRGIFNGQLLDASLPDGNPARQNLYGVDPIQFYVNGYFPTVFQGTDIRMGRLYCPFGTESLEAVSCPVMSRSYAFNWSPPFTHTGLMMTNTFSPQWSLITMLINGNEVWFNPAQEARFAGKLTWTSPSKTDIIGFGMSIGRGKFNTGYPFNPPIISLIDEPNGRNNINVFDFTWAHTFNPRMSYWFEAIYGYQYGVPNIETALATTGTITGAMINGHGPNGTAHWGSLVHYLIYAFTPKVGSVIRFETFDDFEGQRTGYEGLYTAITYGLQFKPRPWIWFRPEIRYDYNAYSKPFNPDQTNTGRDHGLLTGGADLVIRW